MNQTITPTGLKPGMPAREAVDASVDRWDAAAHLESSGFSASVAERSGYATTFAMAGTLFTPAGHHRSRPRGGRLNDLGAAVARSLVILSGVLICVSTIPLGSSEARVFGIAALAWLAGQCVSSATWHGWGHGNRGDAAAGGLAGVTAMVLIGLVVAIVLGEPTALIWVMWTASLPVLVILRPGNRLTMIALAVAAATVLLRLQFGYTPALVVAVVGTVGALVSAYLAARRIRRSQSGQIQAGHLRSVMTATVQTLGQLATLLAIVLLIGPGAFGGVAVAGLLAGLVADPAFELARILAGQVAGRSSRWRQGTLLIGGIAAGIVLVVVAVSVVVTGWFLADPYMVYPDMPLVFACGALVGGLTAGISIQLRSGRAIGAMVLALFSAALVAVAAIISVWDYNLGEVAFITAASILVGIATPIASRCLAHPQSW